MYKFKIKKALFLLYDNYLITNVFEKRLEFRVKIANAIVFVNVKTKIYYDVRH